MNGGRGLVVGLLGWVTACGGPIGEGDGQVDDAEVPQPGWVAELIGSAHDVSGVAVLVDDRTIDLEGFTFDGGGIDARVYVLPAGADFSSAIETDSGNLVGQVFDGETLRVTLPEDVEPSQFNALTVWCVTVGVSFGYGVFEAP